jgi:predicted MPP superfamily phosphohydrolase
VEETLFGGFPISPISKAFRSEKMEQFMKDCHFTVLYDETASIADGQIQIVGRRDGEKAGDGTSDRMSAAELLGPVDKTKPIIVLQHEPKQFKDLADNGADVVLCGHTHNGQVFPGNFIVPFFNENAYGVKELYGIDTIVTAGVGYYGPPLRVGTDSEVTVVNIKFK